jgi:hypothetical protein
MLLDLLANNKGEKIYLHEINEKNDDNKKNDNMYKDMKIIV